MTSNVCQQGYLRLIGGIVQAWPVTPGVAGSSPVHSASFAIKPDKHLLSGFLFYALSCCLIVLSGLG